jgi:hypothetical protein
MDCTDCAETRARRASTSDHARPRQAPAAHRLRILPTARSPLAPLARQTNERRIFECITRAVASQSSKTQYFLITPKLLPDLTYTSQTTVLFIYNGPYMRPATDFMIEDHSGAKSERRNSVSPDDGGDDNE